MKDTLSKYYDNIKKDKNHRLKSWEHCYTQFKAVFNKNELSVTDRDYLSLHLAFYLASLGMYRGSSFILERDYKVFYGVLELLFEKKGEFDNDRIEALLLNEDDEAIKKYVKDFFEFDVKLTKLLNDIRTAVKGKVESSVSDTLRTKIILGAYGSIPAYDRYFRDGLRITKGHGFIQAYSENSVVKLLEFAKEKRDELKQIRETIMKMNGIEYPYMKLIDMYFWQTGYKISDELKQRI